MHRALAIKELRETGWIALVALLLHAIRVSPGMGLRLPPLSGSMSGHIPFVSDGRAPTEGWSGASHNGT